MENIVNSCVTSVKIFRLSLTKYMCCVILFILFLWGDVMKRILIFSDTHGNTDRCIDLIEKIPADAIIHAGDYVSDAQELKAMYRDIPFYYVQGNNDIFSNAPAKITLEFEGKRFFITHGHNYNVKYEIKYTTLFEQGKKENADLIIFGHTHVPYTDYREGLTIINPGSIKYGGTYAVAEIENGELRTSILDY